MPCGTGGKESPAMQENVADPDETENLLFTGALLAGTTTGVKVLEGDDDAVMLAPSELVGLLDHKKETDGVVVCDRLGCTETDGEVDEVTLGFTQPVGKLFVVLLTGVPAHEEGSLYTLYEYVALTAEQVNSKAGLLG